VLFNNAISTASWTLPSHASLLTGRYPSEHGWQNVHPMPWLGWGHEAVYGYPTLGEALQRKGYRTGAFSANRLFFTSNMGFGRGFIRFEDYFHSVQDMSLRTLYGRLLDLKYLHRTEKSKITRAIRWLGLTMGLDNCKRADEVNREVLAWIDEGRQPFLAVLNYIDVHDAASLHWVHRLPAWGLATETDQYDSAISSVDVEIGDLLQQLTRRGLVKNTLVVFTSDHGEGLGQHHAQSHGIDLYREAIHVPLLFVFPGLVPAGIDVRRPVSTAAVAATIMDLVDRSNPQRVFPGVGLDALWTGAYEEDAWPDPLSQLQKNGIDDRDSLTRDFEPTAMDGDMQSLITVEWHFIRHQTMGDQLYNWVRDPGETANLINTPGGQAIAAELAADLKQKSSP
jgi:arylsulfatase A-like enzyme